MAEVPSFNVYYVVFLLVSFLFEFILHCFSDRKGVWRVAKPQPAQLILDLLSRGWLPTINLLSSISASCHPLTILHLPQYAAQVHHNQDLPAKVLTLKELIPVIFDILPMLTLALLFGDRYDVLGLLSVVLLIIHSPVGCFCCLIDCMTSVVLKIYSTGLDWLT